MEKSSRVSVASQLGHSNGSTVLTLVHEWGRVAFVWYGSCSWGQGLCGGRETWCFDGRFRVGLCLRVLLRSWGWKGKQNRQWEQGLHTGACVTDILLWKSCIFVSSTSTPVFDHLHTLLYMPLYIMFIVCITSVHLCESRDCCRSTHSPFSLQAIPKVSL